VQTLDDVRELAQQLRVDSVRRSTAAIRRRACRPPT
jgi:hypothetical protein